MYSLAIKSNVDKTFEKLRSKNPKQLNMISKKIEQILKDPHRFKLLRGDLKGARRVHIDKSFVLVFVIDESKKEIILLDYDHHDNIY